MTTRKHFVYWIYDADGALLYVGMTTRLRERWTEHQLTSAWAPRAASWRVAGPYTAAGARIKEREAQSAGRPSFGNIPGRHASGIHRGPAVEIDTQEFLRLMRWRGYTVREVALASQVSHSIVGHMRSGHRTTVSAEVARRIAATLATPIDVFARAVAA